MLNEKLEVTDHELRLLAISNNKDRLELGVHTAFAEGFKAALTEVKKLDKAYVIESVCEHKNIVDTHCNLIKYCPDCNKEFE